MKNLSSYRKRALTWIIAINLSVLAVSIFYTLLINALSDSGITICRFKELYSLYCPGCGGSRSVAYLLHFDFYSAFLAYPPMTVLMYFCIDIELRSVMSVIRDDKSTLTSFNLNFLIIIPVVILVNFVVRNILLVYYNIDFLGDILRK